MAHAKQQSTLQRLIESGWYSEQPVWWLLWLQPLYVIIIWLRRGAYRLGLFSTWRAPVPVLVVGNISIGGTGKTPLTIALVKQAQAMGLRVGVISRGYGRASKDIELVSADSTAKRVGDEPLLIFQRTQAPVAVAETRAAAAQQLLSQQALDLLITDDGLQHYALVRDAECVVIDGARGFGNGWQLPAGPLREPLGRVVDADAVVVNQRNETANRVGSGACARLEQLGLPESMLRSDMHLLGDTAVNLVTGITRPLASFAGQSITALAGIGNPEAFYQVLRGHGMRTHCLSFADHHDFVASDLPLNEQAVLMTEKDAVKIAPFAHENCWYVPVEAELAEGFAAQVVQKAIDNFAQYSRVSNHP